MGCREITVELRQPGWRVNRKRVHRQRRQYGLALPARPVKYPGLDPLFDASQPIQAQRPPQVWAIDFLYDVNLDGPLVTTLTVTGEGSKAWLLTRVSRCS